MHDTQNQIIARNSSDGHQVKIKKRRRKDENEPALARGYDNGQTNGWGWGDQGRAFFRTSTIQTIRNKPGAAILESSGMNDHFERQRRRRLS
jgi:hypothetical protein